MNRTSVRLLIEARQEPLRQGKYNKNLAYLISKGYLREDLILSTGQVASEIEPLVLEGMLKDKINPVMGNYGYFITPEGIEYLVTNWAKFVKRGLVKI